MNWVPYYRVSTAQQGQSGLGLEAQAESVRRHVEREGGTILQAFTEVESGRNNARPELTKALALCKSSGATLLVGRLDRLSRDLHFITSLQAAGVKFIACDNPHATELTLNILAAVAQEEARLIRERTKAGLAAAKARGTKLGGLRKGCEAAFRAGRKKSHRNSNLTAIRRHLMEDAPAMQVVHRVLAGVPLNQRGRAALAIAELNALAIPCRSGKPWDSQSFSKLLHRARVYGSASARAKIGGNDAAPDA